MPSFEIQVYCMVYGWHKCSAGWGPVNGAQNMTCVGWHKYSWYGDVTHPECPVAVSSARLVFVPARAYSNASVAIAPAIRVADAFQVKAAHLRKLF